MQCGYHSSGIIGIILSLVVHFYYFTNPNSIKPTYQLKITANWDTLFAELVPGYVTTSVGTVTRGNLNSDTSFLISVASFNPMAASNANVSASIHITYRVRLTNFVQSASSISLDAGLTYLSSPTTYADTINATAITNVTISSPTLVVTAATSTLPSTVGNHIAIGETMRWTITINVPEGTTILPTLVISTPLSLEITSAYVISLGNAGMCSGGITPVTKPSNVTFNFPELCNNGDNVIDSFDQVVVGISTIALNNSSNVAGVLLTCSANLTFGQSTKYSVVESADALVVEPALQVIKTAGTPAMGGDFGNNITYTITIAHVASTSYAYLLQLVDVIPDSLQLITSSINASAGTTSVSGKILKAQIPQLNLGQTYTMSYVVNLDIGTVAGSSIINNANLSWNSLPSGYRTYFSNTSAEVIIGSPVLTDFSVNSTSLAETTTIDISYPPTEQVAIGEEVTFRTVASIPNGPADYIYLSQQLNSQTFVVKNVTIYVGSSIRYGSLINATATDLIAFNFTSVNNIPDGVVNASDVVGITVVAVVRNTSANVNLLSVSTTASLLAPNISSSRTLPLQIVEPLVNMTNAISLEYPSYIQAGDVVNFTVVIMHTATSGSFAYRVKFEDTFSPYYAVVPNSITTTDGTIEKGNNIGEPVVIALPAMSRNFSILFFIFFLFKAI